MLPIPLFMRMLSRPFRICSFCSFIRYPSISSSAYSSLTLALISFTFSMVSWVLACRASSASCMRLCRRFIGSRNPIVIATPIPPARIITGTNRQSIVIRMIAAPMKLTAVVTMLGSRPITPPFTTLTSLKTRFTSCPLWKGLIAVYSFPIRARVTFRCISIWNFVLVRSRIRAFRMDIPRSAMISPASAPP